MKKVTLKVTPLQLKAIKEAAETMGAMVGCGEDETEWILTVKRLNALLKANGH